MSVERRGCLDRLSGPCLPLDRDLTPPARWKLLSDSIIRNWCFLSVFHGDCPPPPPLSDMQVLVSTPITASLCSTAKHTLTRVGRSSMGYGSTTCTSCARALLIAAWGLGVLHWVLWVVDLLVKTMGGRCQDAYLQLIPSWLVYKEDIDLVSCTAH